VHTVVLATATDDACKNESEELHRFTDLTTQLERHGVRVVTAWNLLGKFDYLLILEMTDDPRVAFGAMSIIAQSGSMRTESMVAMPLTEYFDLARHVAGRERTSERR
jgi:uncharacterized protein with GYD domain